MRDVARRAPAEQTGVGLVEILVAAVLVGIAGVGMAVMLGAGQAYVNAEGDNRVALFLAQQRIEQLRALGYSTLCVSPPPPATEAVPNHPGYTRSALVEGAPRDDYSGAGGTCSSGTSAVRIVVTVSVSPADDKSPPVVLRSILSPR